MRRDQVRGKGVNRKNEYMQYILAQFNTLVVAEKPGEGIEDESNG